MMTMLGRAISQTGLRTDRVVILSNFPSLSRRDTQGTSSAKPQNMRWYRMAGGKPTKESSL
jgi:hypothetical protein